MLVTASFLAFVGVSAVVALSDWRRSWLLAILCGILQDPVRKLTPGNPVWVTFSIVVVYVAILFATQKQLKANGAEFARRFAGVARAGSVFVAFLVLAAMNGLVTFGLGSWKAPAMSLVLYLIPITTILFGYIYLDREERFYAFARLYSVATAIALTGTMLEYFRISFPGLGLMSSQLSEHIRHLPGLQVRMISGFYRGPDTMGLHAAILASLGMAMAARSGFAARAWPWFFATGWGFVAVMVSGRRKAIYFFAVFAAVFVWRYFRRMRISQSIALIVVVSLVGIVLNYMSSTQQTSVYTRAAATSGSEVTARFEGGALETIRQVGFLGAGLGIATQGAYHFIEGGQQLGWQEGGVAKFTAELGVPGLLAAFALVGSMFWIFLRLTAIRDVPGSSQFVRVTLFALVAAHGTSFIASAQAYSDPLLLLLAAFSVGALFATATLDERLPEAAVAANEPLPQRPAHATA